MKRIHIVSESEKEGFRRYFEQYLAELAQFDPTIITDEHGVPVYQWFDCYWQEKGRYPLAMSLDGQFAGLALVRETAPSSFEIAEFYVAPQFRRDNNAQDFAMGLTELFGGIFCFSARLSNKRAVRFWDKFAANFSCSGSKIKGECAHWFVKTPYGVIF